MSISSPTKTKWIPLVWNEVWLENKTENKMSKSEEKMKSISLFVSLSASCQMAHSIFHWQFFKCVRVDVLRIRFASIIILPLAMHAHSSSLFCFLNFFLVFIVDSLRVSEISVAWTWPAKILTVPIYTLCRWMSACRSLSLTNLLTLCNIMKRLFALCNSIIWDCFCRWLFGLYDTDTSG